MTTHTFVKDFKDLPLGHVVNSVYKIFGGRNGETRNGNPYTFLEVGDKTDTFTLKVWDSSEQVQRAIYDNIGDYIHVNDALASYNDRREITAKNVEIISAGVASIYTQVKIEPANYIKTAPLSMQELYDELKYNVESLLNPDVYAIVNHLITKYYDAYMHSPAGAKIHHNYVGGLLYHSMNMVRSARALTDVYKKVMPDMIDESVLIGGIIIHDIGKIKEYMVTKDAIEVTTMGSLFGHISIGQGMIYEACQELAIDIDTNPKVQALIHVVLAHHGNLEWGSPVKPQTVEAHLVHHIDMIDARMDTIRTELLRVETGQMTDRVFALGNQRLFKHS